MRRSAHLLLGALPLIAGAWVQSSPRPDDRDPIEVLRADLAAGRKTLTYEPKQGYLRSLLKELKIDPSTQTLVFSKGSLQSQYISRTTPRALYFNDEVYVGWIPRAPMIEIMSVHPTRGVIFSSIPNTPPKKGNPPLPKAERDDCVSCHGGRVPSLVARSVFTAPSSYPRPFSNSFEMTPRLPLKRRWGGWYVTGKHGDQRHMGNVVSTGTDEKPILDPEKGANITDLRPFLNVGLYLNPHSDLVALLVLESQMDIQNAIVGAGIVTRERPGDPPLTRAEIAEACEPLIDALLGVDEVRLTSPVEGTSDFAAKYAASGSKDAKGRSLTELDLKTRLFKYGCSPLVYSRSFDALPKGAKDYIGSRLAAILSPENKDARYAHLSAADRQAIREVLSETKPEFARAFLDR